MAKSGKKQANDAESQIVDAEVIAEELDVGNETPTIGDGEVSADEREHIGEPEQPDVGEAVAKNPAQKKSIFAPLIGGILAGVIGFMLAQFMGNDRWPFQSGLTATDQLAEEISGQSQIIDGQARALERLSAELQQTTEALGDMPTRSVIEDLTAQQKAADEREAVLAKTLGDLEQRLSDLENRPIPDVGANREAVELYSAELAAMRQMFDAELAKIAAAQDAELAKIAAAQDEAIHRGESATEIARTGIVRSALSEIRAAAETGQGFDRPLDDLMDAGVEIPGGLRLMAKSGVPTQPELTKEFPDAARLSLAAAAHENTASGEAGGLTAFVRNQLGVRSLQPREGDGADAVLSRAEAALNAANLTGALAEIEALEGLAREQMQEWSDKARMRETALAEIAKLAESIENQEQ